jgi:uncharacterized protein (DUF1778 family)
MRVSDRPAERRESLKIRVDTQLGNLIEQAAKLVGSTRSDFIVDAARRAAQDILLNRSTVLVSPKAFCKFVARVNAPHVPNKRLVKTMRTAAPWE